MRVKRVWMMYAITMFVFWFSGRDNLYGAVTLVENGEARARIYHAPLSQQPHARNLEDDPDTWQRGPEQFRRDLLSHDQQMEKLLANAVADLVYHIERMSGVDLETVATDDPTDVQAPAIVIGPLAEVMGGAPSDYEIHREAFRIRAGDNMVLISGGGDYSRVAAAHGAYTLLNQLGCDWVYPGVEGEVIPERCTVIVEEQDTESAPSFPKRGFNYWRANIPDVQFDFFRWHQRMRLQPLATSSLHGWRRTGHVWQRIVRANSDEFEANPEMYALRRMPDGSLERRGPQVETTHPRVIELLMESISDRFADNEWPHDKTVYIGMGPADGGGMSESAETMLAGVERYNPHSGRRDGTDIVVLLLNTLLEALEDEFPNLHLGYLVYSWHADYPMRYRPHPRLFVAIADITPSRLHGVGCETSRGRAYFRGVVEQWGRLHHEQGNRLGRLYYGYGQANAYLPLSMLKIFGDGIPFDHAQGIDQIRIAIYNCWEVMGANNYVAARLQWEHTLDWRDILREFCEKAYGVDAAPVMERYFLAMTERQEEAGIEAGSFFAYPLIYDYAFIGEMEDMLQEARRLAGTELEKTRVDHMKTQQWRLRQYRNYFEKRNAFDFEAAKTAYDDMLANLHEGIARNHNFGSAAAERFLNIRGGRSLEGSLKYSSDPYRIVYQIPDRLKTAMDRDVVGQGLRFYGTRLNDESYLETLTYSSTWDAQGLYGYRHGAVWYRIPFTLAENMLEEDEDGSRPVGLFLGGADGVLRVWCNDEYVGSSHTSLGIPNVFDLTDHVRADGQNLVAIQLERVGNAEHLSGGLMFPSFLFTGPRVEINVEDSHRPFRVLPGGVADYID